MELIVKNGKVITESGIARLDIGIVNGIIADIRPELDERADEVIDAKGMLVMPGVIDSHVHMQLPAGGTVSSDDFTNGTKAAACGGVTTIVDFAIQEKDRTLAEAIASRQKEADGHVAIDYALHAVPTDWNTGTADEIKNVIGNGVPTFKIYMVYAKQGLMSDDAGLFTALEQTSKHDGMVTVHAESQTVLDLLIDRYHKKDMMAKYGVYCHALSRPNYIEAEAISRAVTWAEATGGRLYIVHLSTAEGVDIIKQARERGISVHAETCPQYLLLDDSVFGGPEGYLYACAPPVRKKNDIEKLWLGLAEGDIDVLATDHCPFTIEQKSAWSGDFTKIPCGLPGVETLLPLIYTFGVTKGRFSEQRLARLLCSNPARLMGIYPKKGVLMTGSDADIVIFDPNKKAKLSHSDLQTNCDWSPYENFELTGFPRMTISRGKIVSENGKFVGSTSHGKFIRRGRVDSPLHVN